MCPVSMYWVRDRTGSGYINQVDPYSLNQFVVANLLFLFSVRFHRYKIEKDLATEIKPIPPQIDKSLYAYA